MLGHLTDKYNDIQTPGIEFLRNIYAEGDLRIRPQTSLTITDFRRKVLEAIGVDPTKALFTRQPDGTPPNTRNTRGTGEEGTALFIRDHHRRR